MPRVGIVRSFVADPKNDIHYLDEGIWLIDAGDYSGDGKSELVFQIGGYNLGDYKLFYDDFKKQAVFEFSYH